MANRWLRQYTVSQLFKKSLDEFPEVVGAGFMGVLGLIGGSYLVYKEYHVEGRKVKRFKMAYVVHRPEDEYIKYLYIRDTPEEIRAHEEDLKPYLKSPWNRA